MRSRIACGLRTRFLCWLIPNRCGWPLISANRTGWRWGCKPGRELSVETPAIPGCKLIARVKRTGRRVSPQTNSVLLVAEIANANGLLRPGLFVHVSIPIGASKDVLCTPAAAVVQHEGARFVFVQTGPKTFRRADVTTGLETDNVVEIVKGLQVGEPVVVQGAMALKSEMLIETLAKED